MNVEKRYTSVTSEKGQARGYCILWDTPAYIPQLGRKEKFKKGSLKLPSKGGIPCYFQHKKDHLLGNTMSQTLRVKEDDKGLFFECDLPESATAIREACKRGDVQGASVSFFANKQNYNNGCREIEDATLSEISLVSQPCHSTPISFRNKGYRPKVKWSKLIWAY